MPKYLTTATLNKYKQIVNDLRTQDIGVIIYIVSAATQNFCNNCFWDSVGQRSTGQYNGTGPKPFTNGKCPVCKGTGKIGIPQQKRAVKATRVWLKQDTNSKTVAGTIDNNIVRLRLPLGYKTLIDQCEYIEVDNIKMEVDRDMPVGFGIPQISCEVLLRRSD